MHESCDHDMLLEDAYTDMLSINLRIRSKSTKIHYGIFIRHFGQYIGTVPTLSHLTEDNHSGFARWLLDRGLSEVTVNQRLHYMRALWRHCCRRGYTSIWPSSMGIAEPKKTPVSWTEQELAMLWAAFDRVPGSFCGVKKSLWWRAFHEVIYWTGERKAAVLAMRWDWIRGDRLCVPAEHRKGRRKPMSYWVPDRVWTALKNIKQPERELIFQLPGRGKNPNGSGSAFGIHYHRLLRIAGLDGKRRGPQQMRRTHASFLARAGGDPTKSLGHSDPRVTENYYLDPVIAETRPHNAVLPDLSDGEWRP